MSKDQAKYDSLRKISDDEVLRAVRKAEPPSTSIIRKEIRKQFGLSLHRNTVRDRLYGLEEDGKLEHKDSGRNFIWYLTDEHEPN